MIRISLAQQHLWLEDASGKVLADYPVSTALAGAGEQEGSGATPRGWHRIRVCIGAGLNPRAVLRGRRPTGEIWTPELAANFPDRDWILGRILWLCGEEKGFNRGGSVDTQRRYIYLHGTPDDQPMGVPLSHGCIRLQPDAMVALFEQVTPGIKVLITED
ncbi:L,D-transpeptidase [Marinospirillum alkaliphilum]|uniref:L,D-transpeptidase catalytic domain n=1 Tax=Marinospirillum alkaliphilum DSM 21637 TaxID=1122209 RepID=A0A1K1UAS1_9GAMM|nr:L,D-transpeptidase [Marinospirillum alkaliphilum]SFX09880.1 L,D-transpeptidase catalytic domain [Marinospirillum alkaliphilum DSM 21637]